MPFELNSPFMIETAVVLALGGFAFILRSIIHKVLEPRMEWGEPRTLGRVIFRLTPSIGLTLFFLAGLFISNLMLLAAGEPVGVLAAVIPILWCTLSFLLLSIILRGIWPRQGLTFFLAELLSATGFIALAIYALDLAPEAIGLIYYPLMNIGEASFSIAVLLKLIFLFGIMLLGTRKLMSFIQDRLLHNTDIDPNLSFVLIRFLTFFLFALGVLVVISTAGINLSALAIFGGALGIGLGFGLQNIASNLVSGFILLMDRSIKRGDVISIGENYGWVEKMGARYIVVRTPDGLEKLIPNANLISSEITNWSHSDLAVRLAIKVGVSYRSDPYEVEKLLLAVARKHARVLSKPEAKVIFLDFGESSLDFELWVWINDPKEGLQNIRSPLRYEIWKIFKENNIEIPFPQRDIHIRSGLDALGGAQKVPAS